MVFQVALLTAIISLFAGALITYYYLKKVLENKIKDKIEKEFYESKGIARDLVKEATNEAKNIIKKAQLDAKDAAHKIKEEADKESKKIREEFKKLEIRLEKREENLTNREEQLVRREDHLRDKQSELSGKEMQIDELVKKAKEKIYEISGYTPEEAKNIIFDEAKKTYEHDLAQIFKEIKDNFEEDSEIKAQWVVSTAIQRYAADFVNEGTVSTVSLPNDDMKGRIIGREGRNIRAFEKITGADLIIDDTPEVVVVSCFNPLRRETARLSLERLVLDGRIHPANIEDTFNKAKNDVLRIVKEEGQRAIFETGVKGLNAELVKLIGRLKFRTSFGQNVHEHSIEVAKLAGLMAEELGLNAERAKRGALLHDIGKAVDHEVDGSHAIIGAELAKRYGEKEEIINIIQHHHGEAEPKTPEAVLVAAADALSAARPGARRETVDLYIKRLEMLEEIAHSHQNVEKAYAIQAGRELRIIVLPDNIDDVMAEKLAYDVAKEIEEKVEYPGQLKVTVIREKRSVAYAK